MSDDRTLRQGATPRHAREMSRLRYEDWKRTFKEYAPPERADLERIVEEGTKCGKCSGAVRALMEEVQPGQSFATDLEILFSIDCRDAACGWQVRQWRTWNRANPRTL